MTISFCIVHWNNVELLKEQLELLFEIDASSKNSIEVCIVDNHSDFFPSEFIKQKYPLVRVLQLARNMGYSFACNYAAAQTSGTWLCFLNPDIHITGKIFLDMIESAEKMKLSAFSPLDPSPNYQKPIPSLMSIVWEFSPLHRLIPRSFFRSQTLLGGCFFIQRKVYNDLGGWDERFFLWFEDSDFTQRLQQKKYLYALLPGFSITHVGGSTFKKLEKKYLREIFFRSLNSYADKHFSHIGKFVTHYLSKRYAKNHLLPVDPGIRVSLIVPNMHHDILESFLQKNISPSYFLKDELIVVTSDPSSMKFQALYPQAIFIFNQKNAGFAQMVNTGFARARGEYVGTVNDDTLFLGDWLTPLCSICHGKVASVTPVVKKSDGSIESAGVTVLPIGKASVHTDTSVALISTNAFNAAAVLFQRTALEKVDFFDEAFGSYLEDLDLGLRFSRSGYVNICCTAASITHFGQKTSQQFKKYRLWLNVKNWWLLMIKNYSLRHWLRFGPQILMERARNVSGLIKAFTHA